MTTTIENLAPVTHDDTDLAGALVEAKGLAEWLVAQLHDLEISGANRHKIPGLLFDIAIEHYVGIIQLIDARILAAAFALVRSEFEAYVRGLWVHYCATDAELNRFVERDELPKIGNMIVTLEERHGTKEKVLSELMKNAWKGMNGYTHGGIHQISRRMKAGAIEPNYEAGEIFEVVRFSGTIAQMSLAEIALLAGKDDLVTDIQARLAQSL